MEHAKVVLHSLGWAGDRGVFPGDEPTAMIFVVADVNGVRVPALMKATVETSHEFAKVTLELLPGSVEYVMHDVDSWAELTKE